MAAKKQEHHEHIDLKVQRRMIDFLNAAKRPDDLVEKVKLDRRHAEEILEKHKLYGPFGIRALDQLVDVIGQDILEFWLDFFGPENYGEWTDLYDTPEEPPVHAALLRNGRVLFIPHGHFEHVPDTFLWDPTAEDPGTGFFYPDNQPDDNLYCSGHSFLSDGQLLVAGGGGAGPDDVNRAWRFDPMAGTNGTWTQTDADMHYARWYPTLVTLGGRRVLVIGGRPNDSKLEVYNEVSDSFMNVSLPPGGEHDFPQTYPGMHLIPGGVILYTRTGFGNAGPGPDPGDPTPGTPYFLFTGLYSGEWVEVASAMASPNRVKGMSAPLLLGPLAGSYITKVIVVGGNSSDTAEMADLSTPIPTWGTTTTVPGGGRSNVNVVLLPDNTVFVCGGATPTNSPVLQCALYNPMTNSWSAMDSLSDRRAYHSVALLLPSGHVAATGDVNSTIEIFSPPYMFRGDRPDIDEAPDIVHHGQMFDVETPQAADIERVVLVRPIAVTHQTDTDQRVVGLNFTRSGNTLQVQAPNGNHPHPIAP